MLSNILPILGVDPDPAKLSLNLNSLVILVGTKFFSSYEQQLLHVQTSVPTDNTTPDFDLY